MEHNSTSNLIMINLMFLCIYILIIISIAIIDKKEHRVSKIILLVGFILESIQIIINYNNNETQLVRYIAYLLPFMLLIIIDTITLRKRGESFYIIQLLLLIIYMIIFLRLKLFAISVLVMIALIILIQLIKFISTIRIRRIVKKDRKLPKIPVGTYLGISTVIVLIISIFV